MGFGKRLRKGFKKVTRGVGKAAGGALGGGLIGGPLGSLFGGAFGAGSKGGLNLGNVAQSGLTGGALGSLVGGVGALGMGGLGALGGAAGGLGEVGGIPGAAGGSALSNVLGKMGLGQLGGLLGGTKGGGNILSTLLGAGLLGGGLFGGSDVPDVALPSAEGDEAKIQQEMQRQRGLFGEQRSQLEDLLNKRREDAMKGLEGSSPEGMQLRNELNRLGLLDSGAFNSELAKRLADVQRQSEESLQAQQLGETDVLSGLGTAGLQRQFGLEDIGTQTSLARALQKSRGKSQRQQSLLGLGGELFSKGLGYGGS